MSYKIDSEFISNFISDCIIGGLTTTDDIVSYANKKINIIDEEIKKLKDIRSKLLCVINQLEKNKKKNNIHDDDKLCAKLLNISNHNLCKYICEKLADGQIYLPSLKEEYNSKDIYFCIKQFIANDIAFRKEDNLFKGKNFNKYYSLIVLNKK